MENSTFWMEDNNIKDQRGNMVIKLMGPSRLRVVSVISCVTLGQFLSLSVRQFPELCGE